MAYIREIKRKDKDGRAIRTGRWSAQIYLGVDPATNKTRWEVKTFDTRKEAKAWVSTVEVKRNDGTYRPADPGTIQQGTSARLRWHTSNGNAATIDQGIGNVALVGDMVISPALSTTYTLEVNGPGGRTSYATSIVVTPIVHPCDIEAPVNSEAKQSIYWVIKGGGRKTYDIWRKRGAPPFNAVLIAQGHNKRAQTVVSAYGDACTARYVQNII